MLEINCPICGRKCECIDVDCDTPNTLKEISVLYVFECQSCAEPFGIIANYELKNATMNYSKRVEVEEPFTIEIEEVEEAKEAEEPKEAEDKKETTKNQIDSISVNFSNDVLSTIDEIFKPFKLSFKDKEVEDLFITKAFSKDAKLDEEAAKDFLDKLFKGEDILKSETKIEDDLWAKPRKPFGHYYE